MLSKTPPPFAISGSNTSVSRGTVVFSNSNGVSFGLNGSTMTASHNAITTARASTDAIGLNTAGTNITWTANSSGLSINAGGYAGTGLTTATTAGTNVVGTQGTNGLSLGVPAFLTAGGFSAGVSTGGNTGGNTGVTGSRLVFVGSQNITLNQATDANGATISFSGGAGAAGNTGFIQAGANTASLGTVNFSNSNGISFGLNGQTMTASHNAITTADLSQNSSKYIQNWKLTGNTAGTTSSAQGTDLWLAGGQGLTVSGNSNSITFSVGSYITTARASTDAIGLNTAQTNVTWTVNSSGLSLNAGGYAGTGFTTATTAGTNLVGTHATNGLSLGVPAWITTAVTLQSNQSAIKGFGASNTGNTAGNTGISTGIDWVLAGTNNITISESTAGGGPNTLWISGATAGGANFSAGASNLGNTAGATGITGTQLVLVGSGPISLSQTTGANGGTLSINAPPISTVSATGWASLSTAGSTLFIGASTTANLYAVGNTFGTSSGTADIRTMSISAGSGLKVAASNSGWVVGNIPQQYFEPFPGELKTAVTLGPGSISQAVQFCLPYMISASFLRFPIALTTNSTTLSTLGSSMNGSATVATTWNAVVYSLNTGANSRSLVSVASGSAAWGMLNSISVAANGTQYSVTQSLVGAVEGNNFTSSTQYSITNTNYSLSTAVFPNFTGTRFLDINFPRSLAAGPYWLIWGLSTSSNSNSARISAGTNCNIGYSQHYGDTVSNIAFGIMGSTDLTSGNMVGAGSFSTAGGGTTSGLPISAISSTASHFKPYFQFGLSA